MNYRILIILVLTSLSSMALFAQIGVFDARSNGSDSLIIERKNGQKIKLIWDFKKNLKKSNSWEELFDEFQLNFGKIQDDIPTYEFYKIDYVENTKLTIDEVAGRETYIVNENDEIYSKSNICKLSGEDILIDIEFKNKSELFDQSLKADIQEAISKIKHRFYISFFSKERHYYSVEEKKMVKAPKPSVSFIMPIGAMLGIVKGQPYIELRPGIGVLIGHKNMISLNLNFMIKYDEFTNKTQNDTYIGFNWMPEIDKGLGIEWAIKVSEGIDDFEDLDLRTSLNYRTNDGILLGVDYYIQDPREGQDFGIIWGFHLGFGF